MKKDSTRYTTLTIHKKSAELLQEILNHRTENMTDDDFYKPSKASVVHEILEREHKRILLEKK